MSGGAFVGVSNMCGVYGWGCTMGVVLKCACRLCRSYVQVGCNRYGVQVGCTGIVYGLVVSTLAHGNQTRPANYTQ